MCLGVPGQIIEIADHTKKLGVIDCGGVRRTASLILVAELDQPLTELIGTWVLVHVGFAMSKIDEEEARRTLALLREMGEAMEPPEAQEPQAEPASGGPS